jgi:hypothetical protein
MRPDRLLRGSYQRPDRSASRYYPPLREAPSLTIIKAKSITLRYADGTPHVMTGLTSFELLGPRVIEADDADVFIDTNEAVLRGSVTMRSAVDEVVARR